MTKAIEERIYDVLITLSAEELHNLAHDCNSWNGCLENMCWYDFDDDFFDTFFHNKPIEAARAVFFGNVRNWADSYIRFDAYGNLESTYALKYDDWEIKELADEVFGLRSHIYLPGEVEEVIEAWEEEIAEQEVC